jgi:hypothetical protein
MSVASLSGEVNGVFTPCGEELSDYGNETKRKAATVALTATALIWSRTFSFGRRLAKFIFGG